MQTPINLPASNLSGYYTVTIETVRIPEAIPFSNKIKHYVVVVDLPNHKIKQISLYRCILGEWITNISELDVELRNELTRQIELNERSAVKTDR
jgi:hypothetical protein